MIVIVDYGMGNLSSIRNMLKKVGSSAVISSSPETVAEATKIILPGIGAFDNAMDNIESRKLRDVLDKKALVEKVPVLGICLGMQILMRGSAEGVRPGLGWIEGEVKKFNFVNGQASMKVPHMGWNFAIATDPKSIFQGLEQPRFYFVHSYFVSCDRPENVLATTCYGNEFVSAVHKGNIMGTQFHPEKSHKYGMQLLKNFTQLP